MPFLFKFILGSLESLTSTHYRCNMRICRFLGMVVFMLSTVFSVVDCCSSRVLPLKDHTAHNVEKTTQQPMLNNFLDSRLDDYAKILKSTNLDLRSTPINITEKSLLDPGSTESIIPTKSNENDFKTDPSIRAQEAGNPNFHVIDIYYTIMRDVLSFECTGEFLTDFCLNKGRCFRYPIGNHSFFSCECADGYVGERCESKSLNEVFTPTISPIPRDTSTSPKILSARIVFSFPMLIAISTIYILIAGIVIFKCPSNCK